KGEVVDVLIPWIRQSVSSSASDSVRTFLSYVCTLTEVASSPPTSCGTFRRIGLVMDVARTSMIHAAAPHVLRPFAVRYAAHQLNLWPRVSFPETSPTLRWTGKDGDASVFRVWGSVPFYRLFPYRSAPPPPPPLPLFLAPGPPPGDPLPPQGPAPSGVSQVDPLPGTAPVEVTVGSGVDRGAASGGATSGGSEPGDAESEGAGSGGAELRGEEPRGAEPAGVESGGAEPDVVEPGGAESEGEDSGGAEPQGAASSGGHAATGAGGAGAAGARGVGVTAGAGGTGGTAATGPGGACTRGTGATGTGGVGGAGVGDPTEPEAAGVGGSGAGGTGVGGAGGTGARCVASGGAASGGAEPGGAETGGAEPGGVETRATGAGGAGAGGARVATGPGGARTRVWSYWNGGSGASGTGAGGAGVGGTGAGVGGPGVGGAGAQGAGAVAPGGAVRPRPYFVPLFQQVLSTPSPTGLPPLLCPPPDLSRPPLQPASPLQAPSPYTEQSGSLTERREPASRPVSPVRPARHRDYELHSLDFSTAFLQGTLHEEIWLRRLPGFTGTTLAALGFAPSTADASLFLHTDTSLPPFYVLVCVDDLVFATADTEALTLVKSGLQKRHTCIDLGPSALRLPVLLATPHSSVYRPLDLSSTFGRVRRAEWSVPS
ncbi:unnamed protein product, partial [Closterium sp. NIES-53]